MQQKVLVVDDEKAIVDILVFNLQKEGYLTITASDGQEGYEKAISENPDLIVLDIMMPKMDGLAVCKQLRQKNIGIPIIMLTAKAEEVDKVLGLELGADDYVTKPFSVRELMARIKANMRRILTDKELEKTPQNIIKSGKIEVDLDRYEVRKGTDVIELTVREFELLKFLMIQKNQVFSRESLLEKVWGYEYYGDVRTVDVTVRRLREKVEDNSNNPSYVMTKRGIGYYFKGEN
ncbi:MAG TPA: DNA-binding response regulator [Clostridiales bacterium]|nr:MAG: DNA-binding response regulator [Clostridiales bacterium GWD2_32_59]HAN10762.1 DNA-binding response regulator [Clostridiales bacterium]